jgi:mRNA-degrading endonuclease YafQ of YafQ-DinJ toxin-antitoxin module
MGLQALENKALSWGSIRKSVCILAEIPIRKSQEKNPLDPSLNNHALREPYEGFRSIDITNDYWAVYEEVPSGKETVAYFSLLGTHKELYERHPQTQE